jgi:hypothetical protein
MTDKQYTHTPKPVCEQDAPVLWNQVVHEQGSTANRPNIIIKNKKGKQAQC